MSESEQFLKGTSQIKILSPEDIEGMRVVCKVTRSTSIFCVFEVLCLWFSFDIRPFCSWLEKDPDFSTTTQSHLAWFWLQGCCINTLRCLTSSSSTVDITVYHNGFHGDLNETFFVGEVEEGAKKLASSFSVVRSYCGHGIHRLFHTAPNVPHYASGWQDETWPDGWTAVTRDGKRSAQFEHTLLVTETGCEILTRRLEDNGRAHFLSQM
ncbi:hypothetical protein XENOCAPTIV_003770 [Xenoophorus captivus]|uniref:Methionine aminopeptidase n=1 Tax=Xenoophorus captivus TaxID=1517983 RepID=A0ABV0S562_9TELE